MQATEAEDIVGSDAHADADAAGVAAPTPEDELCAHLVESGRLKPADLKRAIAYRDQHGGELVTLLVRLGLVSERVLAEAEARLLDLPLVLQDDFPEEPPEVEGLSVRYLQQNLLLPVVLDDDGLHVVMANPRDAFARKALSMATGATVLPRVGIASEIENGIEKLFGGGRSQMGQIADRLGGGEEDLKRIWRTSNTSATWRPKRR